MANITCPQCSRFVDDSAKFCPGCKFNIKKYVKEMKKKGSSIGGTISFGSVYSRTSKGTEVIPELEFLKPAIPSPDKPVPITQVSDFQEQAYEEAVYAAPEAEEAVEEAVAPAAPVYPDLEYHQPTEELAAADPALSGTRGVSSTDPSSLFPKTPVFRPAYKPRVAVQAPEYQPNYKAEHPDPVVSYEEEAAPVEETVVEVSTPEIPPEAQIYGQSAQQQSAVPEAQIYGQSAQQQSAVPETQIYGQAAAVAAAIPPEAQIYGQPAAVAAAIPPEAQIYGQPAAVAAAIPPEAQIYGQSAQQQTVPPEALLYAQPAKQQAVPPEALLYAQPAGTVPSSPYQQPALASPAAYQQPAMAAGPLYQQPAMAATPMYQQPVHNGTAAPAYQQTVAPVNYAGNFQAARQVQPSVPAYQQQQQQSSYQQAAPAVGGIFESAALNSGVSGGGALSGEVSGPTILEKLRAEEEEKKANASIFESASLRAAEKELKNGTRQPAGGLHGEISFDNYIAPERGSFGRATAYQLQQAAYVAAGGTQQQSSVPPYAAQAGSGPGGMTYQMNSQPGSPAYAVQNSMPAYAAVPGAGAPAFAAAPGGGMANPYGAPGGMPGYGAGANPVLGGNANPMLGGANPVLGGNANPMLGGANPVLGGGNPVLGGMPSANPGLGGAGANPVLGGGV